MKYRWQLGGRLAIALVAGMLLTSAGVAAQDDLAASGNGGTGTGSANGGAATVGDVMSGGNAGNAVALGDTGGGEVGGGAVANSTGGTIDVNGGTGIAAADGGEYNIGFTYEPKPATADNDGGDDGGDDAVFRVCVAFNDDPSVCTTTGTCTGTGDDLDCVTAQSFCDDLGLSGDPCEFGADGYGDCVQTNPNRVDCTVLN